MALRKSVLVLVAAASLGLAACHRIANKSANANPDTPAATSGGGTTNAMGGPGTGLAGGMNPASGQSTGVAPGGPNSTTKSAVGNR